MSALRYTMSVRSLLHLKPTLIRHVSTAPPRAPPKATPRPTSKSSPTRTSPSSAGPSASRPPPPPKASSVRKVSSTRPKADPSPVLPSVLALPSTKFSKSTKPSGTQGKPKVQQDQSQSPDEDDIEKRSLYQSFLRLSRIQKLLFAALILAGAYGVKAMDVFAYADREPELSTILDRVPDERQSKVT